MNDKTPTIYEQVLKLARSAGVLRIRDLREKGIHPEYVRRLCKKGLLVRTGRGLYVPADADMSENHTLALASRWIPHGIICLLSTLRFHEMGTQTPHEVWIALHRDTARPRIEYIQLRVMRFSGKALTEGIEERRIDGVPAETYNPAKTVADCLKYRNKIGIDVAIEALMDCAGERRCTMDARSSTVTPRFLKNSDTKEKVA